MVIWLLDCSNGYVTKVKLSAERENELNRYLDEENGDVEGFICKYEKEFGVSAKNSSFMIADEDNEIDVVEF